MVELVLAGQIKEQAGARLVNSINSIARIVTGFQCGVPGLVVQGVPVSQRNFLKLTCSWPSSDTHPDRAVDCSEKNISFSSGTFGSIQLPSSLPYQLAQLDRELSVMKTVVISGFNSDTLFPQVGVISGVVSSSILGATIPNIEPFDLKEPVHVMLRRVKAGAGQLKPVWWDTSANKGLGGWSSHHCTTKEERNDGILFTCSHLGYYTLILQSVDGVSETATPLAEYLSVYLGSILGLISISLTVFIYSLFSSSILLSSSYKQALVNLWLSIILFLVFYCISGEMEEQVYCALTGMLLHYTTLTSFFWLALTSAVIHSKVTGPEAQQEEMENVYGEIANRDESMGRIVVRKSSISKYYLIGWCVPLFICGITAGASFNQYTSQGTCYLSLEVSAGSILAPVLVSLSVYTYYTVHMYTCRSSTRVFVSKKNEGSNDETHLPLDQEKSIRMHGSVQCLFTFLLVCLFTTAGVRSLLSPTLGKVSLRLVCSVLFCALSLSIGVLVLSFYVFSRKDLMMKFTKRESSDRREETTNLLSPHQLRYSPARFQQNIFNPGTVGKAPPFSNMAAAGDINKMAENKQQNTFLKLTGQFMNNKSEAEPYDVFSVKNTGGSVIGYIAPNNSAGPSDLDCLQVSEFGYKPKVKNVNLLVDREKSIGKSVWNQENLEMMAMDNRWEEVEELDEEEDRWSRADQRNPDQDLDYFFNQNQSELSPSLPPPIFSPSPFPGSSTGIVLDSQYNLGERHPSSRDPFPTSLPNKRRSKSRDRSGFLKSGVSDLDRTDVASRYSEVSSSMYSTRSKK
ncbi:adhesion G protein-coupled receptor A3 [Eurytemora carolleeae]|uniref:adhesion G protein-coupled receptor A3 n=1 Tax=Eurytemora carolleeae TaxID=1294199 RepID=UPI000C780C63|nr:adhesion G protein-coupled receptor A3 [Eurytemora carolleeae]|eukprot:XP_023340153.1 adhesion G protein-coupled receptor A3-like [Eurytemora affinis]